ncbi:related to Protein BCP1 [Cephalotrichum gorgonifer]|uniref:Protein BCP1 n=1 Tax=Cephalotrichum gorgonifer TaxID=2041049 RepID=A0AAE8SYG6_9PEZI|nr:related to Protein BCP1 [Cephalotrichum gorgonifer]
MAGTKRERDERDPDAMDESSDEDFDMVNVDFEWFNFDPEVDFHGTKTLLRQLLDVDAPLFDVSSLADLILSQPTVGSTVKTDGKESDAYALITALSLRTHASHAALSGLAAYISQKTGAGAIAEALSSGGSADVGLVLSERLINMPSEVAGPMYSMLVDELDAAVEDKEPYAFSHFLVLSRVYREVAPDPDVATDQRPKNKKAREAAGSSGEGETLYFHPEDEVLARFAAAKGSYKYTKEDEAVADSKRAFSEMGIRTEGYVMLIEAAKFREAVQAVGRYLGSGA